MNSRIKAVREALDLSQREFGEKLGVSRDVISNIEYGRVQPKALFVQHMCRLYGVNAHWLETGEGAMFDADPAAAGQLAEAMEIFKSLRPAFQECALEQMRRLVDLQKKTDPA